MPALPDGTVTFLFTDVQGSTQLLGQQPAAYRDAIRRHHDLLRAAVEQQGGVVFETVGDAVYAAFALPSAAVAAALAGQRALVGEAWGATGPLRVRMGLHTGEVERQGSHYFGAPLYRCARLLATAHGGQVVLSAVTAGLVREALPAGASLRDLGTHPLKDLQQPEQIHQLCAADLPAEFPTLRTLAGHPSNLPVQPTSFVGRERELAEVVALLRRPEAHLLTLTGPGGTGKTRLALQAAAEVLDQVADGAYFVDLAPLSDATLVLSTIAATLGLRESGGTPLEETVTGYLKEKELLLVLDNFEQVLEAVPVVGRLVAACQRLTVLVTSRTVLRAYGEQEYVVPPLALPPRRQAVPLERLSQYAAVALFIERAQAVRPDFAVTNATAPAVAEICWRLDGLPLAIELAAARVRLLPPPALLARLENRLGTLTGGARTLPARQQTLRATIDWSYVLLSPEEQAFFARLSVFVGGRTLAAIEAVCLDPDDAGDVLAGYDVLDGVSSLVETSLLRQEEGGLETEEAEEPRFVLLETLHEYAREALAARGETERFGARHAAYCLALAEEAESHLRGPEQGAWLARLEREHDNLRAALGWAGEQGERRETGLRLAAALWRFWSMRGHLSEGRRWLEGAIATVGGGAGQAAGAAWAAALHGAGNLAWEQGDYGRARALVEESLALVREMGNRQGVAASLNDLGVVAYEQGEYGRAAALHEESLALFREVGDRWGIAISLSYLGHRASVQGEYGRARALLEESLVLARGLGDRRVIALSLNSLGEVARVQGEYERARALYEESLALFRELGDKRSVAIPLVNLGLVAQAQGEYERVRALYEESLALSREVGDKPGIAHGLEGLASTALEPGAAPAVGAWGARLLGAADALRAAIGAPLPPTDQAPVERTVVSLRAALGDDAYEAAWAEGQALTLEEAVALAAAPPA
jgi:predicted ATPase/class 3 adenylate cyclase